MGSSLARPSKPTPVIRNEDEIRARELGLKNNLKLTEVNILIDYYKRKDPNNSGLLPEEFKEVAGGFFASGLTIDPQVIFNIFDIGEDGVSGRVSLREFILGYAILCRGSTEGRLKYLFAIYGNLEGDGFLSRDRLVSALKLMQRIVTEVTDYEASADNDENDKQIMAVADELIAASSDPKKQGISYDDFIEQVKEAEVVTSWLEDLSSVAGEHLKYIERCELDLVELNMERQGLLTTDSQNTRSIRGDTFARVEWTGKGASSETESAIGLSTSSEKKMKIPLPKKYTLVRRDLTGAGMRPPVSAPMRDEEDVRYNEVYAAKPFVINYDQISFKKVLGRGACATVHECEWLHVPVAVKVFNDGHGDAAGIEKLSTADEERRKAIVGDYVEEFWLLLQIRHPNCLLYMGICFEPVVCIVTELYSGGSVSNYLHGPNPRKFTPQQALDMISGVARGMLYLHASSPPILHRDLKASNILINRTITHCVICDFGLSSQFVADASRDSKAGMGVGTPYTMAPEVMQGQPYTPAADIYSFGIVMYEMFTGRFPFPDMKPVQLMYTVTQGKRPAFHDGDNVPVTLRELIQSCWSQNPGDRPKFEDIVTLLTSKKLEDEVTEYQKMVADADFDESESDEESHRVELSKRLLETVYRGNSEKAARLIDQGAKVNYADYDKRTALHVAAAEGRTNCIRLLLSAGARLTYDRWGNLPVVDAINCEQRTGDSEPVRLLRAVEGQVSGNPVVDDGWPELNSQRREQLRNHMAMEAAASGDIVTLKRLLDSGLEVDCADYDRRTPLTVSCTISGAFAKGGNR